MWSTWCRSQHALPKRYSPLGFSFNRLEDHFAAAYVNPLSQVRIGIKRGINTTTCAGSTPAIPPSRTPRVCNKICEAC